MYNALTHTFQSQRLLRHLIRALTARGSYSEAGKAIHLYLDLWNKTRETDAAQVVRDVRKFRAKAAQEEKGSSSAPQLPLLGEKNGGDDLVADDEDFDIDSDRDFVRTACFGTRVFCKYLGKPSEGLKLAKRAREVYDEKKDQRLFGDKREESRIERALGIAFSSLTAQGSLPFDASK